MVIKLANLLLRSYWKYAYWLHSPIGDSRTEKIVSVSSVLELEFRFELLS
jgi:hypothetical protein